MRVAKYFANELPRGLDVGTRYYHDFTRMCGKSLTELDEYSGTGFPDRIRSTSDH
jgi:hypothetical protein